MYSCELDSIQIYKKNKKGKQAIRLKRRVLIEKVRTPFLLYSINDVRGRILELIDTKSIEGIYINKLWEGKYQIFIISNLQFYSIVFSEPFTRNKYDDYGSLDIILSNRYKYLGDYFPINSDSFYYKKSDAESLDAIIEKIKRQEALANKFAPHKMEFYMFPIHYALIYFRRMKQIIFNRNRELLRHEINERID